MKSIEAGTLCEYRFPSRLKSDATGRFLAYFLAAVNGKADGYESVLHVMDTEGALPPRSFGGAGAEITDYDFLPNGKMLLKAAISDGDRAAIDSGRPYASYYIWTYRDADSPCGDVCPYVAYDKDVLRLIPLPDGRRLLLCADDERLEGLWRGCAPDTTLFAERKARADRIRVATEVPLLSDMGGYADGRRTRLYLDGRAAASPQESVELTLLTPPDMDVETVEISPDGRSAVIVGSEWTGVKETWNEAYIISLDDSAACSQRDCRVSPLRDARRFLYTWAAFTDDGTLLLIRNGKVPHGEYQDEEIVRRDLASGGEIILNAGGEIHLFDDIISDVQYGNPFMTGARTRDGDTDAVYLTATLEDRAAIIRCDFAAEEIRPWLSPPGKIAEFAWSGGCVYFLFFGESGGGELARARLSGGGDPASETEILTDFNRTLAESLPFRAPAPLAATSPDGTDVRGRVILPDSDPDAGGQADTGPRGSVPAILFIHGGPNTAYGYAYIHEMQLLADNGYAILFCNPRGSAGRGADFEDIRLGYGGRDEEDLLSFLDAALAAYPQIDPKRIGVTGGSYGGLMTNHLIAHTDRFACAVSERGVSGNISDFLLSDIGFSCVPDTYGATPWQGAEKLRAASALARADRIKTPTLFIHGGDDATCGPEQSEMLYAALRYHGTDAELFVADGETHGFPFDGTPYLRVERLDRMVQWFRRYLK
jgi:dipeptidyl aminopeptidase/acylaminoacyl peptidase